VCVRVAKPPPDSRPHRTTSTGQILDLEADVTALQLGELVANRRVGAHLREASAKSANKSRRRLEASHERPAGQLAPSMGRRKRAAKPSIIDRQNGAQKPANGVDRSGHDGKLHGH
jgi:hypothetical protein